nr:hypothetical protein [Brachybacterium fresconis]
MEGKIPLSGIADGAVWHRARTVATGESVILFIVRGEAALEAADAVRRAYLVEDPHLLPVREIVVLDDPREGDDDAPAQDGPTTIVEYPLPPAPPLAALLSKAPLHPETARSIIGEAATGLEVARRRGVRHQLLDSNRLFVDTRTGAVVVLGVGVEAAAHVGLDRSRETASFQDTAALVALLYRILTGRSPQHDASGTVPRPSTVVDTEIPQDLDLLCDLVLNESADDIPETTRALIAALEPWQSIPVTLEAYPNPIPHHRPAPEAPSATAATAGAAGPVADPAPSEHSPEEGSAARTASPTEASTSGDTRGTSAGTEVDEDTIAHPSTTAAGVAGAGAGMAGAAGAAGALGAIGAAEAADDSRDRESAHPAQPDRPEATDAARGGLEDGQQDRAEQDDAERAAAQRATEEESARRSSDAQAIVHDLHLDQKRGTSPFPGHLDITAPEPVPLATGDEPSGTAPGATSSSEQGTAARPASGEAADGADTGAAVAGVAAGGAAAAGAGAAAVSGGSHSADVPARTSGTQWPLAPSSPDTAGSPAPATDPHAPAETRTPSQAPGGGSAADPAAVTGRGESVAPAAVDGPIVVHGRGRSSLDDEPAESTLPASRSSLLRDVVSVAVDHDDPDSYAWGPQQPEERSRQSQWIIAGAVLLTIIAAVFAVTTATSGLRDRMADPLDTSAAPAPTETETGEAPVEPTAENTEEPELPSPELDGVELSSHGGGDPDHTDQQDRLTDGDPSTYWSTQHYASPDFGGLKDGVGIRIDLAEKSELSAVTVTTARNTGGTLELRTVNEDGSPGDVLASGEFAGDSEVRLEPDEPVETGQVMVYIPELPPDSDEAGRFRARIAEISVE